MAGTITRIRNNTRVLYLESPGSITFEVQDIPALAEAAHKRGVAVLMDNTWATPLYFKPFAHGVDVSIQAGTKYLVGHSDAFLEITNTAVAGESALTTDPDLANNSSSVSLTVQSVGCSGDCGPGGNATGTLDVVVAGLQGGATSTITVGQSTYTPVVATSVVDGTIPFTIKIGNTYEVMATTTIAGYAVTSSAGCSGTFATSTTCTVTFTPPSVTLAITPTTLPDGTVTVPYTETLTATGTATGPFMWTVASGTLPDGLTLGTSTASTTVVSGIPTATGTYPFVVSVTNGSTTATQAYTITIGAIPDADLAVAKTVDDAAPSEGGVVNYTVTVSALGPATSTGVTVEDNLPPGLTLIDATTSRGTYVATSGLWTVGDMSAGATSTLLMSAMVDPGTASEMITNIAVASETSAVIDQNPNNNSSSVSIIVQTNGGPGGGPSADLSVTKTVDNASPNQGDTVDYTVTVSALGPATSTGVVATDTLPGGLTFVSASTSVGSYASSTGTWTIGDLPASTTASMVLTATVNAGTAGDVITNTAVAGESIAVSDPNLANNIASVSLTVVTPASPGCTTNCGGGGGGGGGGTLTGGGGSAFDIAIDGGIPTTATTSATLSLYGTGAYTMELSNSTDFSSSTWIPYATVMPWILTSGDGEKTVYVNYRNVQGQEIGSANASINLITGAPATGGQVLGAATSCGLYLRTYIHPLAKQLNDPSEVKKLQIFLNGNLGINLPITGYYGFLTIAAVNRFQLKYNESVLAPWVPYGLPSAMDPTGYVYKTTQRWINVLMCPPLDLPLPHLP